MHYQPRISEGCTVLGLHRLLSVHTLSVSSVWQSELYSKDWIGLRVLDKSGRVDFLSVPGNHLHLPLATINTTIVPYLDHSAGLKLSLVV